MIFNVQIPYNIIVIQAVPFLLLDNNYRLAHSMHMLTGKHKMFAWGGQVISHANHLPD